MSARLNHHWLHAPFWKVTVVVWMACPLAWLSTSCGGGQSTSDPPPNPVPSIASISPSTATRGGSAFTLTVNGSNFLSASTVQWNGTARTTSFIGPTQLSAQIIADDIVVAQPYTVTVVNPSPGGGKSVPFPFDVPCVLAPPTAASSQTAARLGSFYFDGWGGPLDSFHLKVLVKYPELQMLSGWRDDNACAVEQQLAWARSFGLNFFVYDWFYKAKQRSPTQNLNAALEITRSLPNRHGMQFAIMYTDDMPGAVLPADWNSAISEWMSYMTDRDYVRVNGKPLFILYDMGLMHQIFGSSPAVATAFDQLRTAAQAQGLGGVYIVGGFFGCYDPVNHTGPLTDLSMAATDGYDAVTMYGFGVCDGTVTGEQPYSLLSGEVSQWIWSQVSLKSPVPYLPLVVAGQDARADRTVLAWFSRTPQDLTGFVSSVITLTESNPQLRPEPSPAPPVVLIGAWNELLEGSYIVPTVGEGTSYGDSLAAMLATRTSNASAQASANQNRQ